MNASELKIHQYAIIKKINISKNDKKRFFYLGIYVGGTIQLMRVAPFQGPYLFSCSNNEIMLRKKDASCIEVEVIG